MIGKVKVTPIRSYDWDNLPNSEKKLQYLMKLGLSQRENAAVSAIMKAQAKEVTANMKLKSELEAFGFPADKIEAMFADKPTTLTQPTITLSDIFPESLDKVEVSAEEAAEETEETEEEETEETEETEE